MEQKSISIIKIWIGSIALVALVIFIAAIELFSKDKSLKLQNNFNFVFIGILLFSSLVILMAFFIFPKIIKSSNYAKFYILRVQQLALLATPSILGLTVFFANHNPIQLLILSMISLISILLLYPKKLNDKFTESEGLFEEKKYATTNLQNNSAIKFSPILLIPIFCWIVQIFLLQKPIYLLSAAYNFDSLAVTFVIMFVALVAIGFGGALKLSYQGTLLSKKALTILCSAVMLFPIISQILITGKEIDENKLRYILNRYQIIIDPDDDRPKSSEDIELDMRISYCKNFTSMVKIAGQKCEVNTDISDIIFWELILGTGYIAIVNKYQGKKKEEPEKAI